MSPSEHHPEWGRQRAAELGSHLQACPLGTCLHAAGPGLCPWHLRPHLGSGREVGREEAGRVPTTVRGKEEHRPGRPERGLEKPQLGCRTAPSAGEVPRPQARCPASAFLPAIRATAFAEASSWRESPGSWSGSRLGLGRLERVKFRRKESSGKV